MALVSKISQTAVTLQSTAVVIIDALKETIRNLITTVALKMRQLWQVVLQALEEHLPRYSKLVFDRIRGRPLSWQIIGYAALFAFVQLIIDSNFPAELQPSVINGASPSPINHSQVPVLLRGLQGIVDTAIVGMNNSTSRQSTFGFASGTILAFIGNLVLQLCQGFMQSLNR